MDRRKFLTLMGMAGAAAALPWRFNTRAFKLMTARAYPFAQSPTNIRKFVTTLPGLGPGGANNIGQYIPLATKITKPFQGIPTDTYNLQVKKFTEMMHPDLPGSTTFWGYRDKKGAAIQQYLGGVVVATRGTPVLFNVTNSLPNQYPIPADPTLMASEMLTVGQLPFNRIVTHMHGGLTPWFSDGTPFQWYTPKGKHGSSFMNVPGTAPSRGTATYYYPFNQSSRLLIYHDHAMGLTRTNAYLGIASVVALVDPFEISLVQNGLLPDLVGIPLVIQDKGFVANNILAQDPTWKWGKPGSLWYPHQYEADGLPPFGAIPDLVNPNTGKARWGYGPTDLIPMIPPPLPLPNPSVVAEGFFDTMMVNGAPYPVLNVNPTTVRFRILSIGQARFLHLNLLQEDPANPGEIKTSPTVAGPTIWQFGTEGGFLPGLVAHPNNQFIAYPPGSFGYPFPTADPTGITTPFNLLLGPAERAEVLVDFSGAAGQSFILFNDAPAPFPGGDGRNWYFTGDPDFSPTGLNAGGAPPTVPGHGPNSFTIMKIVVSNAPPTNPFTLAKQAALNTALRNNFIGGNTVAPQQPGLLYPGADGATPGPLPCPAGLFAGAVVRRSITLNEDFDDYGRLIQRAGTTTPNGLNNQGLTTYSRNYTDPATETPTAGTIEIWDIYNLTMDTHPWHFHLVNVQVVQRAQFDAATPIFAPIPGTERLPDPNEYGWKETVRTNPGEVTTVIAKFDLPVLPPAMGNPLSPRTGGHEYVHHCHILEHEEHDMMRPMVVI